MRSRILSALVLGLSLVAGRAGAEVLDADIEAGKTLLTEGDALADKGKTTDAVLSYKRAFEQLLPNMRKIPFRHEVKRDVTPREGLRAMLLKEIDEEMTPAEFHAGEVGMKALGLLPRDIDLKETLIKVYTEQIAAFYDTKTKTMHLVEEPEAVKNKPPTLLERLLGKTSGFDKDENRTVIAHELTHALADQNFNLDTLQKAAKGDDDRSLALSSLIEGEATLVMFGAGMSDWNGTEISRIPARRLDRMFGLVMQFLPMAGGASLREVPVILSESMIFPYLRGMVFCAHLTNEGSWKALDDAYRNPPLSTEQIIHPEKYRAQPDPPTKVDLGTLDPGPGWKELGRNVVGEMQLGVLLRRHGGKGAAAGWDGDRYAVFEGPGGRLGLVWATTWDSDAEADEFARNYTRLQAGKAAEDRAPAGSGPVYALERRGADVAVVEGFGPDLTTSLLSAALEARKTEMAAAPSP